MRPRALVSTAAVFLLACDPPAPAASPVVAVADAPSPDAPPDTEHCTTRVRAAREGSIPTLEDGKVALYPGESACIEYVEDGPVLRLVRTVPASTGEGAKVLALSFGKKDGKPALAIRHGSPEPVRFATRIVVPTPDGKFTFLPADPCPVRPREAKVEAWDRPVEIVVLGRFALTDEVCPP